MSRHTVTVRNLVLGEGLPKICVPLVAKDAGELEQALERLKSAEYDLVEWRADHYRHLREQTERDQALASIRDAAGEAPVLFTIRTRAEGGEFEGTFEEYASLCRAAAASGLADLVDVEYNTARSCAAELTEELHRLGVKVIGSSHDFARTPERDEMTGRLVEMQKAGMDITKLAVMPGCRRDVMRLLEAAVCMEEERGDRPCITMAMGETGFPTRFLGEWTGSAVTFASAGRSSAPGQVDSARLRRLLLALHGAQQKNDK